MWPYRRLYFLANNVIEKRRKNPTFDNCYLGKSSQLVSQRLVLSSIRPHFLLYVCGGGPSRQLADNVALWTSHTTQNISCIKTITMKIIVLIILSQIQLFGIFLDIRIKSLLSFIMSPLCVLVKL